MGFVAHVAQQPDGLRRRVLLPGKTGHKPASTNLAARLQAAQAHEKLAPGRKPVGFARQQSPEDDAPATQKCPRNLLDVFVVLATLVESRRTCCRLALGCRLGDGADWGNADVRGLGADR